MGAFIVPPVIAFHRLHPNQPVVNGSRTFAGTTRYIRHEYRGFPPSITPTNGSGVRRTNGYQITDDLKIAAWFYPGTADAFPAAWREGGRATTASGDEAVWGFLYADAVDRAWGSPENPDVYVKIWFDVNGRVDINYFHVSVPNIRVESNFRNGSPQTTTVTFDNRYVRHEFQR